MGSGSASSSRSATFCARRFTSASTMLLIWRSLPPCSTSAPSSWRLYSPSAALDSSRVSPSACCQRARDTRVRGMSTTCSDSQSWGLADKLAIADPVAIDDAEVLAGGMQWHLERRTAGVVGSQSQAGVVVGVAGLLLDHSGATQGMQQSCQAFLLYREAGMAEQAPVPV